MYFTYEETRRVSVKKFGQQWIVFCKGGCRSVLLPDWQTAMLVAGQHRMCQRHVCNTWYPQFPDTYPPFAPPVLPYYQQYSTDNTRPLEFDVRK